MYIFAEFPTPATGFEAASAAYVVEIEINLTFICFLFITHFAITSGNPKLTLNLLFMYFCVRALNGS